MLGQMPRAGGVLDQYPETLEAFRVITSAIRKAKEK